MGVALSIIQHNSYVIDSKSPSLLTLHAVNVISATTTFLFRFNHRFFTLFLSLLLNHHANCLSVANAPKNVTGDLGRLTDVFGYHIVPGNFSSSVTRYPNVTLGRTLLTDPALVHLEGGNKAQVVAWAQRADNRTHILNQRDDSTVLNVTTIGNLTVYVIDHLLTIPQDFNTTVPTNNESLSAIQTVLGNVQTPIFNAANNQTTNVTLLEAINEQWHGFTFFAPNNNAVQNATNAIQSLVGNATAVQNVLYNHVCLLSSFVNQSRADEPPRL